MRSGHSYRLYTPTFLTLRTADFRTMLLTLVLYYDTLREETGCATGFVPSELFDIRAFFFIMVRYT